MDKGQRKSWFHSLWSGSNFLYPYCCLLRSRSPLGSLFAGCFHTAPAILLGCFSLCSGSIWCSWFIIVSSDALVLHPHLQPTQPTLSGMLPSAFSLQPSAQPLLFFLLSPSFITSSAFPEALQFLGSPFFASLLDSPWLYQTHLFHPKY